MDFNQQQTQSIQSLVKDLHDKRIVLPEFQRDFVWEVDKTYDLFDSLIQGIFIGAIIYGVPSFDISIREIDTRPRTQKNSRRKSLKSEHLTKEQIKQFTDANKAVRLALDGQQRITSLYRAIKGIDEVWFIAKNKTEIENGYNNKGLDNLLYDLKGKQDDERLSLKLSDIWKIDEEDLSDEDIKNDYFYKSNFYKNNKQDIDEKLEFTRYRYIKKKITELFKQEKLLSHYLLDMSLEKFVTFFERSNTKGIQLSFIDILIAKLHIGNFNLRKKIDAFKTEHTNYKLVPEIIVRTIAYIKSEGREVDKNFILNKLKAEDFNENWDSLCLMYRFSIDYLNENHLLVSQDWLPYENMLIPMMIFAKEIGGDFHKMNQQQKDFLTFWYLNSIFSLRFSGSSNERIVEDTRILTQVAKNQKITSPSFFNRLTKILIQSDEDIYSYNRKGNAIYKGILNLINYHSKGLIDWNNNSKLSLNSTLEDHHIFPQAFLKVVLDEDAHDLIDCVANRTLVPKSLNIKIGAKSPYKYLNEIAKNNQNFSQTLENHCISNDLMSSENVDYKIFLDDRCKNIFQIVQTHLVNPFNKIKEIWSDERIVEYGTTIEIFAKYKGQIIMAQFVPSSQIIKYNGVQFDTPSAAASAAKITYGAHSQTTENGWTFWKYIDRNGAEKLIDDFRKESVKIEVIPIKSQPFNTFTEQPTQTKIAIKFDKNDIFPNCDILVFTNQQNVYKLAYSTERTDIQGIVSSISFNQSENPIYITSTANYQKGYILVAFENGKCAKIYLASYKIEGTKTRLNNAYFGGEKLIFIEKIDQDLDLILISTNEKIVLFNTQQINPVGSKNAQGNRIIDLQDNCKLNKVCHLNQVSFIDEDYYRKKSLPSTGYFKHDEKITL